MKTFNRIVLPLLLLGLSCIQQAQAQVPDSVSLSLTPSSTIAGTGDTVTFDLTISGLGNFSSSSLGDYDFDLSFDPARLSFDLLSSSFGTELGFTAFEDMDAITTPGILALAQLSLEDAADLIANQPGSFSLASLTFNVLDLMPGQSTAINFATIRSIGDEIGDQLTLASTNGAVISNPNTVPEPMTLALIGVGLAGIRMTRRKHC
ncbi:cohesin domain-containing protein [Methylomonas sp. MgM2]